MNIRNLFYVATIGLTFFLGACEKEETDPNNGNNNNNNPGANNLANNTIYADTDNGTLNLYTAYRAMDVNTNKEYINIFIFRDNPANSSEWIEILLNEIPSSSKMLDWQSGASAPGDITADEFVFRAKVNNNDWYGVYSTNGWETSGQMTAEVDGSNLILSFKEIELGNSPVSPNVTQRADLSGKMTFDLADLQNLGNSPTMMFNLVN